MAVTMGTTALNAGLGAISNIGNAQNSTSSSQGTSLENSWGTSASNAWSKSNAWSEMAADAWDHAQAHSESFSQEGSEGYSRTYGREASAQDILNAAVANEVQKDLWSMQALYNAQQAQIDREYQAYMSNTAYQRAVADLKAAGLNPILAAGNMGASTPVGAMASSGLGSAAKAQAFAESESYNSSWGSSRSTSDSSSEGESHSRSASKSSSKSKSKSSSSSGSHGESQNTSNSETTTQLKELANIVGDIFNAGSAKDVTHEGTSNKEKSGRNKNGYRNGTVWS